MSAGARETQGPVSPPREWDWVAKAIGVAVVLLPATGAAVRWIAYGFEPEIPSGLAARAPVAELAAEGLLALVPAVVILVGLALYFSAVAEALFTARQLRERIQALEQRVTDAGNEPATAGARLDAKRSELTAAFESLRERLTGLNPDDVAPAGVVAELKALEAAADRPPDYAHRTAIQVEGSQTEIAATERRLRDITRPRWTQAPSGFMRLIAGLMAAALWVAVIAFAPGMPAVWLNFVGMLAGAFMVRRVAERRGRVSLTQVVPAVLVVSALAATAYGLQGHSVGRPAEYTFEPGFGLPAGRYLTLAADEQSSWLASCVDRQVHQISTSRLMLASYDISPHTQRRVSLVQWLSGGTVEWGAQLAC